MQDNPARTIKLYCWIIGISIRSFSISIEETENVEILSEIILNKKRDLLPNANADQLIVWKTSIRDKGDLRNKKEMRKDQYVIEEALASSDRLSIIFPSDPPEGTISIVFQVWSPDDDERPAKRTRPSDLFDERNTVPALAPSARLSSGSSAPFLVKRSHPADEPKHTHLAWLNELHEKIWNQQSRRPELFREVIVTAADYAALQKRLTELHPDRDKQDYDGDNSDVLSDKLTFLRSRSSAKGSLKLLQQRLRQLLQQRRKKPRQQNPPSLAEPLSSQHDNPDDDDDASDEDGIAMKSLFPYLLTFMDLSPLALETKDPGHFTSPLLYRDEYEYISELIRKKPQNNKGSVVVSGQPGLGKTAYLYLRIIENMIDGRSFLYQVRGGAVYHVGKTGVVVAQSSSWSSHETIVALVDGDEENSAPNQILRHRSVQVVVASSPKVENERWIKQLGSGSNVSIFVMEPWTAQELFLTGIFLTPDDLSFELLEESTSYFGYNPRGCFEASSSVAMMKEKSTHLKRLITATPNSIDIMQLFDNSQTGGSTISHSIFQISPSNSKRLIVECEYSAVSRWALNLLLLAYEAKKANMAADFYFYVSGITGGEVLRGHLFERQVLNYLSRTDRCDFQIRRLTGPNKMTWIYHGDVRPFVFHESTIRSEITKAVQKKERLLMIPSVPNFPAVDSILYDPEDPSSFLTGIQITRNKKHDIVVSGLRQIQKWLKSGTSLGDLRPSKKRPWRFVFVVPLIMADTFTLQDVVNDDKTKGVADWPEKVQQYVLGLDDGSIFRTSDSSAQQGNQMKEVD